ncbi:MAG: tRNA dihydrouridine synthase DusB [Chloroflexi bacterium]|nr:tRNA dihydrouridine synthase DusB [Chloroflexota bacterium]
MKPTFFVRDIPVNGDLILSPMDGYSDQPFRSLCREFGSAMSYTEFLNVDEIVSSKKPHRKLTFKESERPVVFQVFGHDEDRIVAACRRIQELGPDIIDLNMGCSVKDIAGRGAGAGLLCDPPKIGRIFNRLARELSVPVTGKIRLGWDDSTRNYLEVARIIEQNGGSLIAIHGRTKKQMYKGEADWGPIAEIKQAVKIPVVGNGDVRCAADIERLKRATGCDAVMIGRAAIGNPWIFQRKDRDLVTLADKISLVRRHLAENLDYYGPELGLVLFRKHVVKYIQGMPGEADIRIPLLTCQRVEEFVEVIAAHFGSERALAAA